MLTVEDDDVASMGAHRRRLEDHARVRGGVRADLNGDAFRRDDRGSKL